MLRAWAPCSVSEFKSLMQLFCHGRTAACGVVSSSSATAAQSYFLGCHLSIACTVVARELWEWFTFQLDEVVGRGWRRYRDSVLRQSVQSKERQGCETGFLHFKQVLSARVLADITLLRSVYQCWICVWENRMVGWRCRRVSRIGKGSKGEKDGDKKGRDTIVGLRKHQLQCMAVGKWLEEIASDWTPILQFLQHLFKIPYGDTELNVCGWLFGTSPTDRPNTISHLCLLVLCTDVSCAVIGVHVCFGCSEFCFSSSSICFVFNCSHCV